MDSDRKCKFHRFCPARSDCNNIAHAILSCYKLQGAFNQFNEKIWKLQLKYFSYKRDQRRSFASTFICISKLTNLYERILKMQALIGLKKHIVYDYLHNSETRPRSPFDRSNFVCSSSTLRISDFYNNWMKKRCRVVLKHCVNVIGRNACALA